ncbi:hypothetical protein IHE44_0003014 [Lamprotornis superbus]|uniref:trimethyllysine dioxygenase n=1 Tax=Lamprotornis superbus TaxID=245042 RepID=A0A835TLS3_9PASS|nr:hypothetical protein IHE44_0003014 [Lamprotornis superbus]
MAAAAPPRGGLRRPRPRSRPGPAPGPAPPPPAGSGGPAAPLRGTGAAPGAGELPRVTETPRFPRAAVAHVGKLRAAFWAWWAAGAGGGRGGRSGQEPGAAAERRRDPLRHGPSVISSEPEPSVIRMWCQRLAWLLRGCHGSPGHHWPRLPRAPRPILATPARCHPTAPASPPCAWQLHQDHLELRYGSTVMRLDFVWLRDHCRSASCYNAKTNQRSLDTASVDLDIQPQAVRVDETTLFLTWPDGHVTRYGLEWLARNSYEGQQQQVMHPRILWNADIYQQAQVPSIDCQHFLQTHEGLKEFLQNFLLYGIAFVENVPPTKEDTEILAKRISIISIQVFHCLKHEGTGGRTLLVDGFHAAEQVRLQAPELFELLAKVPLKHEYVENVGDCHNHMIGALFVDNWRVLHGREAFTGYRQLCGCYLTRDDVLNTARLLGLQA